MHETISMTNRIYKYWWNIFNILIFPFLFSRDPSVNGEVQEEKDIQFKYEIYEKQ